VSIVIKEYTEEELQEANKEKLAKAIEYLGNKWLLHKDNSVGKKNLGEKK